MARPWNPTEQSRQPTYRRTYNETRKLYNRIDNQDGCITFLLVELRALQKRITKLEQHNDDLTAAALRLAHNNAEEFREPADDRASRL
jgi:hypothetical protein